MEYENDDELEDRIDALIAKGGAIICAIIMLIALIIQLCGCSAPRTVDGTGFFANQGGGGFFHGSIFAGAAEQTEFYSRVKVTSGWINADSKDLEWTVFYGSPTNTALPSACADAVVAQQTLVDIVANTNATSEVSQ